MPKVKIPTIGSQVKITHQDYSHYNEDDRNVFTVYAYRNNKTQVQIINSVGSRETMQIKHVKSLGIAKKAEGIVRIPIKLEETPQVKAIIESGMKKLPNKKLKFVQDLDFKDKLNYLGSCLGFKSENDFIKKDRKENKDLTEKLQLVNNLNIKQLKSFRDNFELADAMDTKFNIMYRLELDEIKSFIENGFKKLDIEEPQDIPF